MIKNKNSLVVAPEAGGLRLDVFISHQLAITRSQAQKLIEQGQVLINEKRPKKTGEKVKEGDVITIVQQSSNLRILQSSTVPEKTERLKDYKIKIISETSDYIVVEKPTGRLTHPTMAGEKNTLVDFLIKKYPEIKMVSDRPAVDNRKIVGNAYMRSLPKTTTGYRPGIVHRLDKETSGLLVVARTQKMFNHLKEQFKNRTIGKEYYALVHGKVAKDWSILTFPIARGKTYERMAARPVAVGTGRDLSLRDLSRQQRDAKTEFLVERRFVNFTLLRVTLHTGRMHQIRVHLLAYNHPLVGDPLYFQKKRKRRWDERLGRLFLHATKLSFTDLAEQRQTFESPLPEELEEFLKSLK